MPSFVNVPIAQLIEIAVKRGEGLLTNTGALRVCTGKYTGRAPNDKFIVDTPEISTDIWWENNKHFSHEQFRHLYYRVLDYLKDKEFFVFNGYAGADPTYMMPIQVINELAWQNIFVQQLFIRPDSEINITNCKGMTIVCVPGFKATPTIDGTNSETFVILNLPKRMILIGGTHYAGEIKKALFTAVNYFLPKQGILTMHCAANQGANHDTALFFGLSGTGKTSLSADPQRNLIGDDEHGWSNRGVFNIEGGCYAKCIDLAEKTQPQIWNAIKFGSVLENVSLEEDSRTPNYTCQAITENTRAAYPITHIPHSIYPGRGNHPKTIFFLSADAFGVLPLIAKLNTDQAMDYFLAGYTSKLAGTEIGISQPAATFSPCFGAPFLPLHPLVYANLLKEKIQTYNTNIFLVNTGWQEGAYGTGKRIDINITRQLISAALTGELDSVPYSVHPIFQFSIPLHCTGIDSKLLSPQQSWQNQEAYLTTALSLLDQFHKNQITLTGQKAGHLLKTHLLQPNYIPPQPLQDSAMLEEQE